VVVVEAGLKSGTIMTARRALDENRQVFVVPGPPMVASYEGSLELLIQGASLVRGAEDILNFLQEKKEVKSFSGLLYRIARNSIIDLYRL
jgi:DNA processing protein